jgi:hypothetical protein
MDTNKRSIAWQQVDDALSMPDALESYLHRDTGEVVALLVDSGFEEDEDERERVEADPAFIAIPTEDAREAYQDMDSFAATVEDDEVHAQLDRALDGRGAFARFRDVLRLHSDLQRRFHEHQQAARIARFKQWLEAERIDLELHVESPSQAGAGESSARPAKAARPGLIELLMLGGKSEYIEGAVRRHLLCDSEDQAHAAFKRIAREITEAEGVRWRKRDIEGRSEFRVGRFHLVHHGRHLELHVHTPLEVYLAFSD